MSYITEFTVRDQNEFSDHCPIDFSLLTHSEPQAEEVGQCSGKIVWDSNKCEDFMCNLVRTPSTSRFEEMMLVMNNVTVVSQHDIQLAVDCFTEGVRAAADPLFYRASGKSGHQRISSGPPWGDSQWKDCKQFFPLELHIISLIGRWRHQHGRHRGESAVKLWYDFTRSMLFFPRFF